MFRTDGPFLSYRSIDSGCRQAMYICFRQKIFQISLFNPPPPFYGQQQLVSYGDWKKCSFTAPLVNKSINVFIICIGTQSSQIGQKTVVIMHFPKTGLHFLPKPPAEFFPSRSGKTVVYLLKVIR